MSRGPLRSPSRVRTKRIDPKEKKEIIEKFKSQGILDSHMAVQLEELGFKKKTFTFSELISQGVLRRVDPRTKLPYVPSDKYYWNSTNYQSWVEKEENRIKESEDAQSRRAHKIWSRKQTKAEFVKNIFMEQNATDIGSAIPKEGLFSRKFPNDLKNRAFLEGLEEEEIIISVDKDIKSTPFIQQLFYLDPSKV
ncbi:MAG: hypothetical protein ACFFBD_13645 [Candidatus Hodarchaeota archaeon]